MASAISKAGVRKGEVVSVMVPNVPVGLTCHFAVPGTGSVLHMINTRLDAATVAFQVDANYQECHGIRLPKPDFRVRSKSIRTRQTLTEMRCHKSHRSRQEGMIRGFAHLEALKIISRGAKFAKMPGDEASSQ